MTITTKKEKRRRSLKRSNIDQHFKLISNTTKQKSIHEYKTARWISPVEPLSRRKSALGPRWVLLSKTEKRWTTAGDTQLTHVASPVSLTMTEHFGRPTVDCVRRQLVTSDWREKFCCWIIDKIVLVIYFRLLYGGMNWVLYYYVWSWSEYIFYMISHNYKSTQFKQL